MRLQSPRPWLLSSLLLLHLLKAALGVARSSPPHLTTFVATTSKAHRSSTRLWAHLAVHVFGKIKPGTLDSFDKQTIDNARHSIMEKGIARFDYLQGPSSPDGTQDFALLEVYRNDGAPDAHKQTDHYARWKKGVEDMMAVPCAAKKYKTVFPPDPLWVTEASAYEEAEWGETDPPLDVVLVDVQVVAGREEDFMRESIANARSSLREPGIHRFDVLQSVDDPSNFILLEVYSDPEAPAAHKLTSHYNKWRETVEGMMARPRSALRFKSRFPGRVYWHHAASVTHPDSVDFKGRSFEVESPRRIVFGEGVAGEIGSMLLKMGLRKPLVVTGKGGSVRYSTILQKLVGYEHYVVDGEPTIQDVEGGLAAAKESSCDCVVAIGGGSAIDVGKAISALIPNPGEVMDYMEVVGRGQAIKHPAAPFIAVPTTSGTGSEVTKNAVVKSSEHGVKASIRSPLMMPAVALIDPLLTISVPPHVTAHTGLDALCQCIEPYVSNKANPITDALAKEGILRAARSLRAAYRHGGDVKAREDMAVCSVMGGLALANAKLGAVHGFAGVIGGMFEKAPHGALCAALMPPVFRANVLALTKASTDPSHPPAERDRYARALQRHVDVARIVTGNPEATAEDGVRWLATLVKDLKVPGLSSYGVQDKHADQILKLSAASSSMAGNPIKLSMQELDGILRACMH